MTADLVNRGIGTLAEDFLSSFRVVIINGPRQSGKTTLLRQLEQSRGGAYVSLDDSGLRTAARADPIAFVHEGERPLLIDEIQRGGDDLVLAIKQQVDSEHTRGQFVLAGSTRFLSTPSLSESLAGRAAILEVWPFAEFELHNGDRTFPDLAFEVPEHLRATTPSNWTRRDYFDVICRGGYPEVLSIRGQRPRDAWFRTYTQSIIDSDIREMARVDEPSQLARLLGYAAANTAQELELTKAASDVQLHRSTVHRYLGLLETVFLLRMVPAWSRNLTARAVRRSKVHVTDTGLAAHLLGVNVDGLAARISPARGPLIESFVVNEISRQAAWSETQVRLSHWRIPQGNEVDLVLERANGAVVGIEVKAAGKIGPEDFRGLSTLRDRLGDEFVHGFALYTGPHRLSFGDRLTALPISALWGD